MKGTINLPLSTLHFTVASGLSNLLSHSPESVSSPPTCQPEAHDTFVIASLVFVSDQLYPENVSLCSIRDYGHFKEAQEPLYNIGSSRDEFYSLSSLKDIKGNDLA